MTLSNKAEDRAASIDHAMMGLPQKSRTFFRGIRLLPPLAGMTATRWGYLLELKQSCSYVGGAVAITIL